MLAPRKVKYRKQMRGKMKGNSTRGVDFAFGDSGLVALDRGWITSRQIEAARRAIAHYTQRTGRVWIRIFPDKPITKKPLEVGMGAGKGDVHEYVAPVLPGRIVFEIGSLPKDIAGEALRLASHKLPIKTKIIFK